MAYIIPLGRKKEKKKKIQNSQQQPVKAYQAP